MMIAGEIGAGVVEIGVVISTGVKIGPSTGMATNNGVVVATGVAAIGVAIAVEVGDN